MNPRSPSGPPTGDPSTGDPARGRGPHHARRRRSRYEYPIPRLRWVALTLVGFLLSGAGGAVTFFLPAIDAAIHITGHSFSTPTPKPEGSASAGATPTATPTATPAPVSGAPFTVLLLGSDNDGKFGPSGRSVNVLTQSMILVRVDPTADQVTMLSIPRDLWVPLSGGGSNKIDSAYGDGGVSEAIATVEEDFDLQVDHYVWIGLQGLVDLIDDVGGIDLVTSHPVLDDFYPGDLTSSNPNSYARVAVLPGPQHMDGEQAMEYVRSRHDDIASDLGRAVRQQQVLVALRQKISELSVGDIPRLASTLSDEVLTDIPLTQFPSLLGLAQDVGAGQIQHVFLTQFSSCPPDTCDGTSALLPSWGSLLSYVHQYFPAV
ncbi:MAG: LCP family protein [Candidatus Dormibacteria bacterium]|jgi:LCP family protein required for cell wall assembly